MTIETPSRWFIIKTTDYFFGLGSENEIITFAPEKHSWMIGKTFSEIKPWMAENKKAMIELKEKPNTFTFPHLIKL